MLPDVPLQCDQEPLLVRIRSRSTTTTVGTALLDAALRPQATHPALLRSSVDEGALCCEFDILQSPVGMCLLGNRLIINGGNNIQPFQCKT